MIRGFADLHNHQFAYLGFGGWAFHGRAYRPIAEALPHCDFVAGPMGLQPLHGPWGTTDVIGTVVKSAYTGPWTAGHHVGGYPAFDGWPRWMV